MTSPEHDFHVGDRVTTHSRLVPGRLAGQTFEVDAVMPGANGVDTIDLLADDGTVVGVSHFTVSLAPAPKPEEDGLDDRKRGGSGSDLGGHGVQ
ncbi:hypothetical protein [uncultured Pseudokineococcus sp.]|uniref:hypothetical protein n=1 Tax=uncultured Pseudokineococcus sp. TaxID=1642928 RepID=UPI00260A353D|nr:hypothetical protein [uncultured Pseudokineococcus sp.]